MNEHNDERLREVLRRAMAPVADRELKRDLWPRMLQNLNERAIQVPWFDWVMFALAALLLFLFPEVIPALLYNL